MAQTLAWPFTLDATGAPALVDVGSDTHAQQVAALIATTIRGERVAQVDAGVLDRIGQPSVDTDAIAAEISDQAPWVKVNGVAAIADRNDPLAHTLTIDAEAAR